MRKSEAWGERYQFVPRSVIEDRPQTARARTERARGVVYSQAHTQNERGGVVGVGLSVHI